MFPVPTATTAPDPAADSLLPFEEASLGSSGATVRPAGFLRGSAGVRLWLVILISLVFLIVIVGGLTRLTGSGLSITEWKPVIGAVPPMSQEVWQEEFALYRTTPQYEHLNRGMSLGEFKFIYWWEWGHRQLGRFIGLVYLVGLVFVTATRRVSLATGLWLFGGGLLLALQGLVGWIMVASGLRPGMIAVEPVKLTLHLTLASIFFAFLIATHTRIGGALPQRRGRGAMAAASLLAIVALMQITLGGLVAGHDAGMTYNTWPLMDGRLVPAGLMAMQPAWHNFTDNITMVQFNHRIGGYALAALVLLYALWRGLAGRMSAEIATILALVLVQVGLGVATLLLAVPWPVALAHQAVALILFGLLVRHAARPAM
ncbi:COX15/CtaA family protein [Afifella pfennigii]|uniref:COX15/CtaA family protein n=1 Tax=Afifella pfennigii TaxID=209897 RepID=UPI0009FE4FE0|nr:COX15/CtaA family protein [Afifella pfennigii]